MRSVDHARLSPRMQLVDVGTGDGPVAFRAIGRIGATLRVQMTARSA
jgi:arsenite methyltransferase